MTITEDSPHYVTRAMNMPPTELECKCGHIVTGPDCLAEMTIHITEGNSE